MGMRGRRLQKGRRCGEKWVGVRASAHREPPHKAGLHSSRVAGTENTGLRRRVGVCMVVVGGAAWSTLLVDREELKHDFFGGGGMKKKEEGKDRPDSERSTLF